jgi:hypothetical protein
MKRACQERRHMTLQEFAVWTYASQVSHKSGIFYGDVRRTAGQFREASKSTIHRILKSLEGEGWLRLIREPIRENDGTFTCAQYRVISHDKWVLDHPGRCATCPASGTGCNDTTVLAPVPNQSPTCPKSDASPVPPAGQRFEESRFEESSLEKRENVLAQKPALALQKRDENIARVWEEFVEGKKFSTPQADINAERNRQLAELKATLERNRKLHS